MSRRIDVCGVQCNTGVPDSDGVLWKCAVPEGWVAASQTSGFLTPTGRDGSVGLASWWSGRILVVKGWFRAPSDAAADAAFNRVASAMPGLRGSDDLVVYESAPKSVTVVQHGEPRAVLADPSVLVGEWQVTLRADYPLKRALTSTTTPLGASATTTITNNGNTGAYPVVTVTSSGTVDLVIGGRHFTTSSLASGVYIDMWARTIRDSSGNDVSPWPKVPATEWLAIPPGSQSLQQAGTAALSIVTSDTYA